jgi:predicted TIM-barrel fold metal-dependent hydrolase
VTDDYWFISVDDHVVEPPHLWWDRLSVKERQIGPRVERDTCKTVRNPSTLKVQFVKGGDGPMMDWWLYEDLAKPIEMVVACAGIPIDEHNTDPIAYADMRPGCYDPKARLSDMDLNKNERSLCFPSTVSRFCGQMFLEASDKELASRCVEAYNDWMVEEWCGDSQGRLIPLCLIQLWDPMQAAAEIRRNAARGVRALTFSEMPHYLGLPSIHDPSGYWDPVFAAADETGTVVCMHIGSGSSFETSPFAPRAVNTVLTFSNAQKSLVEWLCSGLLVRYPNLKIAYSESQVGWMPFVMERLDKTFTHTGFSELPAIITEPPTSYIKDRVFGCFFDDETGIANREAIGVGQMLFETDYPHQDSTWPHTDKVIAKIASQVSEAELEMILRTNALRMLNLD